MLRALRVDSTCIGAALAVLLCLNLIELGYLFNSQRGGIDHGGSQTTNILDGHTGTQRLAISAGRSGSRHSRMAGSPLIRCAYIDLPLKHITALDPRTPYSYSADVDLTVRQSQLPYTPLTEGGSVCLSVCL